jgi:bacillithiol biosynthesis cysteine-adding enzyme BshC
VSLAAGIDVRRFSWIRPLVADYATNFSSVAEFYAGDPSRPDAWRQAIARTRQHRLVRRNAEPAGERTDVALLIRSQQANRNAPPEARASAATLVDPETVAVVTGQQAGAFGGPLYTLLKAITAIQLARRVSTEHQVPAVPVFWVEAEDHDWDEVQGVTLLDADYRPTTLVLDPPDGAGKRPVAELTLDDRVNRSIEAVEATLSRSDFTSWVVGQLREAWRPGERAGTAFARWLEQLLGPYGLVVFEGADTAAKPLVADLFARELQTPGQSASFAAAAGKLMTERGHQPQVNPPPDGVSLFLLDGARRAIRRHDTALAIGDDVRDVRAMAAEAVDHPERFSPNVLLRPVVQDTILPTVCYVAGPSELAYLGQLRQIYDHFGVPMPLMYPRATATLVDSAAVRFLAKYDVTVETLQAQDDAVLNRLLEAQLPKDVDEALADARAAARRTMERVIEVMPAVDPTLAGAAKTTLGRMEHDLQSLHGKVIQAAKKRDETLRRQFVRTQAQIFPNGHPQERTLGVIFFLNKYGPGLIDRLLEELPLEMGKHWIITV